MNKKNARAVVRRQPHGRNAQRIRMRVYGGEFRGDNRRGGLIFVHKDFAVKIKVITFAKILGYECHNRRQGLAIAVERRIK